MKSKLLIIMAGLMISLQIGIPVILAEDVAAIHPFERNDPVKYSGKFGSARVMYDRFDQDVQVYLGCISNGDWVLFKGVNFGEGASQFFASISGLTSGPIIRIMLDSPTGTPVGVLQGVNTCSFETYGTVSCQVTGVQGVHDLYLVLNEGFNLEWFMFVK